MVRALPSNDPAAGRKWDDAVVQKHERQELILELIRLSSSHVQLD